MKKEIYEELTRIGERRLAKMGANFSDYLQVEPGEILLSKKRILPPQCIRGVSELGIAYHLFELPNRNNIECLIKKTEEAYNCRVYHVVVSKTAFSTLADLLFVSEEDLPENEATPMYINNDVYYVLSNCCNLTTGEQEIGEIGVIVDTYGGIVRCQ